MRKMIEIFIFARIATQIKYNTRLSLAQHYSTSKKCIDFILPGCFCGQYFIYYHTSCSLQKSKPVEKKPKNIIQFKPKSKQPVIQLWKGVTLVDIADATKRDLDDVLEAASYIEYYELYKDVDTEITDVNTIASIAKRLGFKVQFVKLPEHKAEKKKFKDIIRSPPPDIKDLIKRPPVVAIMGHVDHGKTTLLDTLRHSSVVSQEFGGITQHIGAFTVSLRGGEMTFLDTPGHAAFKSMRARGANATDLVVLVVAADDGIMEQTVESIRFAKEANVPIIVAINKIDKPSHNIEKVKQGLLSCGIQVEDYGGDVQAIPISALKNQNIDLLTEAILTQAEVMGISGDFKGPIEGIVLEASLDTSKGKVSTALIQRGSLRKGNVLVAGTAWAKVRNMFNDKGQAIKEATPGMPVQVTGWKSFPQAGEIILQAESEKHAREVVHYREQKAMEKRMSQEQPIIEKRADVHLQKYREERMGRLLRGRYRRDRNYFREKESSEDLTPHVSFVLKGDVHGSVEAILDVVNTYTNDDSCRLNVLHSGVGSVTENDIELAEAFQGFIYLFNVSVPHEIKKLASEKNVALKSFNVIYHLIEDIKGEVNCKLPLVEEEEVLGEATVLQEFLIKDGKRKIPVAGCRCVKGTLKRQALCKVVRSGNVVYNGRIVSLKHEKTDVESIKKDVECGLMVEDPLTSFSPGDTVLCYSLRTVAQVTDWNPGF